MRGFSRFNQLTWCHARRVRDVCLYGALVATVWVGFEWAGPRAASAEEAVADPDKARAEELQTVKIGKGTLQLPKTWQAGQVTSRMRVAQFSLPAAEGTDPVELVVFHFGGGATGGVQANLDRWEGQFHAENRQVSTVQGKCRDGEYVLSNISGTWKKPDGPPFAQKTIDKPGSRVISVIWIIGTGDEADHYFLKLSGPDAEVQAQADTLRQALGVVADSEKPYQPAK